MSTPPTPLTRLTVRGPRWWLALVAIVVALGVVVGVGVLGRPRGAQQAPTPIASLVAVAPATPVAAATPKSIPAPPTEPPPAWTPWDEIASASAVPSASRSASGTPEIAHVTGEIVEQGGTCTRGWCRFDGRLSTSDGRLPRCYVLQTAGGTTAVTWGTVALASAFSAGWVPGPLKGTVTWEGEWLAAGTRPSALDDAGISPSVLGPVDAIWLHGLGEYKGLSAVLRISPAGQIDGWVFPTPPQP
jgi:hypothetical protein